MPTITLANNIGQPSTEQVAQTQKVRFSPVTISSQGDITPAKELPPQGYVPAPTSIPEAVETAPETPAAPAPAKSTKTMQDEERMNAIIRREKAMRNKIRESEAALAQAKIEREELLQYKAREEQYKTQETERQERMKLDPVGFMLEQGFTQDQITQAMLNQPGPESQMLKGLSEKILKLEREQQESLKRQETEANNNYQNALKTIQRNVDQLVENNPEFETIKASDAQKSVTSYIEKVWKEEGIVLDTEEAAKEIEDYLTEKALGLTRLKKIQSKLNPAKPAAPATAPVAKSATPAQAPAAPAKSPTLTNRVAQTTRPLTSRERAIRAFRREPI